MKLNLKPIKPVIFWPILILLIASLIATVFFWIIPEVKKWQQEKENLVKQQEELARQQKIQARTDRATTALANGDFPKWIDAITGGDVHPQAYSVQKNLGSNKAHFIYQMLKKAKTIGMIQRSYRSWAATALLQEGNSEYLNVFEDTIGIPERLFTRVGKSGHIFPETTRKWVWGEKHSDPKIALQAWCNGYWSEFTSINNVNESLVAELVKEITSSISTPQDMKKLLAELVKKYENQKPIIVKEAFASQRWSAKKWALRQGYKPTEKQAQDLYVKAAIDHQADFTWVVTKVYLDKAAKRLVCQRVAKMGGFNFLIKVKFVKLQFPKRKK